MREVVETLIQYLLLLRIPHRLKVHHLPPVFHTHIFVKYNIIIIVIAVSPVIPRSLLKSRAEAHLLVAVPGLLVQRTRPPDCQLSQGFLKIADGLGRR